VDFQVVRFFNRLGAGSIDPVTLLLCDTRFLVALWSLLALAAYVLDKRVTAPGERPRGVRAVRALVIALSLHFLISEGMLKHGLFAFLSPRLRPYMAHPLEIVPIGTLYKDSSFPSSHNASTAAVVVVFAGFYPRSWPLGALFLLAIAFSRMHNGMHYPTDVLAGASLGLVYGWLALRIDRALEKRRVLASATPSPRSDGALQ
jgi:membrane-associated phospholipid phosphatase